MEAYAELTKIFSRLHNLQHVMAVLEWDCMVNMPPKGAEARSKAKAEIEVISHAIITDVKLNELMQKCGGQLQDNLNTTGASSWGSPEQKANFREMKRAWEMANKLPSTLVERKSLVTSRAEEKWRTLRAENDWKNFVPFLKEVVDVSREEAGLLAQGTDLSPYEALLDQYEPGVRVAQLNTLFQEVKSWLPALLQKVTQQQEARNKKNPIPIHKGPFPVEKQEQLCKEIMKALQFDFDAGRLDVSGHPMTIGCPEDARITTRYYEDDLLQGILGVVHETGHAKYEQNRPRGEWRDQPAGSTRGIGIHESQSLTFEMQIARSLPFLKLLSPLLVKYFGTHENFSPENLYRQYTIVQPGLIRVDADEICYPLHVILRYEIEKDLIEKKMEVEDIPALWDSKMKEYLGLDTTGNFKDGPMQDIHWGMAYLGYFPTYTLGAMYAAQLMAAMRRDLTDAEVDKAVEQGNMDKIFDWLRDKVWSKGCFLTTNELVIEATGEPLNARYYKEHLVRRYDMVLGPW